MRKKLLMIVLLVFLHTPEAPAASIAPTLSDRNIFMLNVVKCHEATSCVMNMVGDKGLLGKQIAVWVGNYQAPSAHHYRCKLEQRRGQIAATFLQETLRNADYVFLVNAHKKGESPYLTGTLMVDGRDVTVLMFEMQLAVPRGIKVDWCEKNSRRIEV